MEIIPLSNNWCLLVTEEDRVRSAVSRMLNIFALTVDIYDVKLNKQILALALAGVTVCTLGTHVSDVSTS